MFQSAIANELVEYQPNHIIFAGPANYFALYDSFC